MILLVCCINQSDRVMNRTVLSFLLAFAATTLFAQRVKHSDVPQVVKDALYKMYPNAKVAEWEMENGNYEAEFGNSGEETAVLMTPAGAHVMTEVEIAVSDLPQAAQDYVKNNLSGKKIMEAVKITAADGTVSYEAEAGGEDYLFDANGNYTGTEDDDRDNEDDGN